MQDKLGICQHLVVVGLGLGKKKNQREVRDVQGLCEKEKETTKVNVQIAQNTQFH